MDVFNRATTFGGSISADGTVVTFDDFTIGFLLQRMQLAYAQNITRIFELSSNRQYYIIGRPQGNIAMSRVVGPGTVSTAFLKKFGDACNAPNNTINLSARAGCDTTKGIGSAINAGGVNYTASNVLITNMGVDVAAQDMLINEQYQLIFSGLEASA